MLALILLAIVGAIALNAHRYPRQYTPRHSVSYSVTFTRSYSGKHRNNGAPKHRRMPQEMVR